MQTLFARSVSANGQVIVGQGSYVNVGFQAFVFPNPALIPAQVPEPLGDFCCGNVDSIAWSVSGNGLVIGGRGETTQNYQMFRWTRQTGMVALPGVAGYSPSINDGVYGINHDGSVMVGQFGPTAFYV
jgi:uncharacterized membrane protein